MRSLEPNGSQDFAILRVPPPREKKSPNLTAISQGGLDLWLEQASDFFAGRQRCI
jgi:hypothetical protein